MPEIPMPPTEWWSDRGLATVLIGIMAGLGAVMAVLFFRARMPYLKEKWQAEVHRELAAAKLFDTLREGEPTKVSLLQAISGNQHGHAQDCRDTHTKVIEVHELVKDIHAKVV